MISRGTMDESRILMLSYHYPPAIASGCARIKRFVDNLPHFGFEPLVVTVKDQKMMDVVDPPNVFRASRFNYDCVALPDTVIRKTFKMFSINAGFELFDRLLLFPDNAVGFVPGAVRTGFDLYREKKYDLIYVTCKPFSTAIAAVALKKKLNLPLVVDLRDPYAYDFHEKVPKYYFFMRQKMEEYVLKHTDCLIINTLGGEKVYRQHYPNLTIKTIHNGYDYRSRDVRPANKKMIITHAGHLYGLRRSPERLFAAMSRLKNCDIVFRSIGDTYKGIMELARHYGIEDRVELIGSVDHQAALTHIAGSDVLFLTQLPYYDRHFSISIANKTFEYLETGKPVIADVPEGDNADMIHRFSSNSYVITDKDQEKIVTALSELYTTWKHNDLKPQVNGDFLSQYNGYALTEKLAESFRTLLAS